MPRPQRERPIPKGLADASPEVQAAGCVDHAANVEINTYDWFRAKELAHATGHTVSDIVRRALAAELNNDPNADGLNSLALLRLMHQVSITELEANIMHTRTQPPDLI